ncbi:MAG: UDP-glucose 4-epimerase GalE [Planctomycetota bacterium]|jgi:UDP-glucose-4-epimerase GalE
MGKQRIVVVGGAGYIGSCCARMLADRGHPVTVLDNLSSGHPEAVPGIPLLQVDLLDRHALQNAFETQPDASAVLLFAGLISVPESVREPGKYYRNNLVGALNLLDVMIEKGVRRIVFSSSAAVYGVPKITPIPEDAPLQPVNPYGRIKKQIEEVLHDLSAAGLMAFASLRYFNASGAEPDGSHGEDHDPETHLIPLAIAAGSRTGPPLKVFGTDYPTPDGSCIRDYIHVRDLARAHLMVLDRLRENPASARHYNLGCGEGVSVFQIVRAVSEVLGVEVPVETGPRRPGDPPVLVAGARKIRDEFGWAPEDDLKTIVESAVAWHGKHPRGYGSR